MIQSNQLPEEAIAYLNEIEQNKNKEAVIKGREGARQELLQYCNDWFTSASTWRKQSYEDDWLTYQRNSDGRYDPVLAKKKLPWQSKAFVDLTPSHRENIQAELFRLVAGSRPILDVSPRPGGDPEQAENIRDLELREFEKCRFEVVKNSTDEDKTTYGSGFSRIHYETKKEKRPVKVPIPEPLNMMDMGSIRRRMAGQPQILGYQTQMVEKVTYRGVRMTHVPIWDFFPDPKSLEIRGHNCAYRSRITLQEIMDSINAGLFMPESGTLMADLASSEVVPPDRQTLQAERGISDVSPRREGYQKAWDYYELYGRIPQKWIYPLLKQPMEIDSADCLVAARVIFHKQAVFAVELNDDYEGEPPFYKDDYLPVNGRFYGRGIPEMLRNPQGVINEVVNQRLDEGDLALNEGIAVVEKAVFNKEDLISRGPGLIVRMDGKQLGPNGDVRNAIFPLGRPDVKINAGFTEVHEWERMAQERTSANRVTLGDASRYQGAQRTLGGMQILKQTAGEKFAFIAMLSEFKYLYEVFRAFWKLLYVNIQPEDILAALGEKRALGFKLLSPEDVEMGYRYEPKGIFEKEAKAELHARLAALFEQFKGAPWVNNLEFFDQEAKSFGIDPERLKVPEPEAMEIMGKAQQMAEPLAKQMLMQMVLSKAASDIENDAAGLIAEHKAEKAKGEKKK